MYLTRIQLDLTKTKTMQALVAPKLFHGAIECAEPEGRTRKLWRLDTLNGNQYLLILTESPLDFSEVVRQFGTGTCAETKKYGFFYKCWGRRKQRSFGKNQMRTAF